MRRIAITCMLFFPMLMHGQSWELITSVKHRGIDVCALDQAGNIYVADQQGTVSKYSKDGKLAVEYAPQQLASIHELTATSQLKVTLFYKDLQEFVILNRYLSSPITYRLPDFNLGYIEDVAPNFQQTLWVLDISDFALKLIDPSADRLLEIKSLAQVLDQNVADVISFHSHQNRMYLIDRSSGVHVFDNIGNYLFKLMDIAPEEAGFDKDQMYYEMNGDLHFVHLYNGESQKRTLGDFNYSKIANSNGRLVAITPKGFNIYQYLSGQ